jgi:hypothetical protein
MLQDMPEDAKPPASYDNKRKSYTLENMVGTSKIEVLVTQRAFTIQKKGGVKTTANGTQAGLPRYSWKGHGGIVACWELVKAEAHWDIL